MHKRILSIGLTLALLLSMTALLSGCSGEGEVTYNVGIVSDGNALSDNHLNQPVWEMLKELASEHQFQYSYVISPSNDTATFMAGIDSLVKEGGCNVIVLPGVLFTEAFTTACAKYPDVRFIAIDCNPETVPQNGAAIVFDKSQAGFLAGYAAAVELKEAAFGGVFGSTDAQELISGFLQGIDHARSQNGAKVSSAADNFVCLDSRTSYPRGQQAAATLFDSMQVTCLLTGSDPTGMGALAEARVRRQAGDNVWAVCSDADGHITARYDEEQDLSACLTTAMCDYAFAFRTLLEQLLEGDTAPFGHANVFDLTSGGVGLPEDPVHLSEDTLEAVEAAADAIKAGDIIITVQ